MQNSQVSIPQEYICNFWVHLRQIREKSFTEWLVFQQRNLDRQSLIDVFFFPFHISFMSCGVLFETSRQSYWETLGKDKISEDSRLDLIALHPSKVKCSFERSNFIVNKCINRAYRQRDEGERLRDTSLASINASETSLHVFFMSCTSGFRNKWSNSLLVCKLNWENKAFEANGLLLRKKKNSFSFLFFFFYEGVVHFQVMLPSHLCLLLSSSNHFFSTKDSNDVVTAIKLIPTISQ